MPSLGQIVTLSCLAALGSTALVRNDIQDRDLSLHIDIDVTADAFCIAQACDTACKSESETASGSCDSSTKSCICHEGRTSDNDNFLPVTTDDDDDGGDDGDEPELPPICDPDQCLKSCEEKGFHRFTCGITGRSCICLGKGDDPLPPPKCDSEKCVKDCRNNGYPTGVCGGFTGLTCICRGKVKPPPGAQMPLEL